MTQTALPYTIHQHCHIFAAWAASRAASVVGCRFKVEKGRGWLESVGLSERLTSPNQLPSVGTLHREHRQWRDGIIRLAQGEGLRLTHGVAAKLINVYLKSRFVCGGYETHPKVQALHPPIDSLLLTALVRDKFGGLEAVWKAARLKRWSKFDSHDYETLIQALKDSLPGKPLWHIEEYWKGNQ